MIKLKNLLFEATRKELVLSFSRKIIDAFKAGKSTYTADFEYMGQQSYDEPIASSSLVVHFEIDMIQPYAYSISAGVDGDDDTVDIIIQYNPNDFPAAMPNLVAEVKETLEHEIEHVGQRNFDSMFVVSNSYDKPLTYPPEGPQAPTHELYLISNNEVPAYVKGLVKRAKVKKISLNDAMEDYYNDYKDTFKMYSTSWSKVKNIWMGWWKKNKHKLDPKGKLEQ